MRGGVVVCHRACRSPPEGVASTLCLLVTVMWIWIEFTNFLRENSTHERAHTCEHVTHLHDIAVFVNDEYPARIHVAL